MNNVIKAKNYSALITDLASLIEQGRRAAVRYVNTTLVATYWLVGRRIVEFEQKGREWAELYVDRGRSIVEGSGGND
ncbi:MAG: DUF1016 N-terminal domain-containing protein [Proteobacteria bacterium]|nr:DUF1016 N-terminal domain-containing protein [Pseudomonadota bacterium]